MTPAPALRLFFRAHWEAAAVVDAFVRHLPTDRARRDLYLRAMAIAYRFAGQEPPAAGRCDALLRECWVRWDELGLEGNRRRMRWIPGGRS